MERPDILHNRNRISPSKLIQDHPGTAISAIVAVLVLVKAVRVSDNDYGTSAQVIRSLNVAGTINLLAVSVLPTLIEVASAWAFGLFLQRVLTRREVFTPELGAMVTLACVAAFMVPWNTLSILWVLVGVVTVVGYLLAARILLPSVTERVAKQKKLGQDIQTLMDLVDDPQPGEVVAMKSLLQGLRSEQENLTADIGHLRRVLYIDPTPASMGVLVPVAMTILLTVLGTSPWVSAEVLRVKGQAPLVGYVVGSDSEWLAVLVDRPRHVSYVRPQDVLGRETCYTSVNHQRTFADLIAGPPSAGSPPCRTLAR